MMFRPWSRRCIYTRAGVIGDLPVHIPDLGHSTWNKQTILRRVLVALAAYSS